MQYNNHCKHCRQKQNMRNHPNGYTVSLRLCSFNGFALTPCTHSDNINNQSPLELYCQGPPTARRSPWRSARLAPWRRQPSSEIETWRVEVGHLSQNAWLEPKWLRISTYLVYLWGSNRGLKSCQGLCHIISSKFKSPSHPLAWFKGFFTGNHHDTPWTPLYSTGENHGFSIDWNTPETMAFSKYGVGSLGPEVFCHRWGKRITPTSPGVVVFHIDVNWKPKFQWGLKVDILLYFDMVYRFFGGYHLMAIKIVESWSLKYGGFAGGLCPIFHLTGMMVRRGNIPR